MAKASSLRVQLFECSTSESQNEGSRHSSSQSRGQDVPSVSVRVAGKGIQTSHTQAALPSVPSLKLSIKMLEAVLKREFQNEGSRHSSSQSKGQDVPSVSVRVAGKGIQTSHTQAARDCSEFKVEHQDARGSIPEGVPKRGVETLKFADKGARCSIR